MASNRIRLTYTKNGPIRYAGHLDLYRVWERIIRRSHLPIAFSNGFHPQVRMSMGCALPLGFTSQCELIDLWFIGPVPPEEVWASLTPVLPPGLEIIQAQTIDEHAPALQTQVLSSVYEVTLLDPVDAAWLSGQVTRLLAAPEIQRVWREKPYNLRPFIESLECLPLNDQGLSRLRMQLSAREGATGRPEEVINALGADAFLARVDRVALYLAEQTPQASG